MSPSSTKAEFTIRSANQTLPLVKMIVQDIFQYSTEIADTRERLEYLIDGRDRQDPKDEYARELHAVEAAMQVKAQKVEQCIRELADLNIETSNAVDGFVDFPAQRENEAVHLCWCLGEKEVLFWHEADEPCSKRRPIDLALIRQSGDTSVSN